jgi:cytochrome P450
MEDLDFLEEIIRARYLDMGLYTFRFHNLFNTTMISTAEPENIQAILATKFHDFDLGPQRRDMFYEVLGNGIFTAEGQSWAHFRHQLKPQFTRDQVSDLDAAERHLNVLFKVLPEENALGWVEATDLLPLMYRFTMDVATEFLFGQSVNSQSTALHSQDSGNDWAMQEDKKFAEAMNYVQEYISYRFRLKALHKLMPNKKFLEGCTIIKTFADRFVQQVLSPEYKPPVVSKEQKEKYVLLNELVKETRDPIELRDQVLHILLAGRDTTAAMLSWCIALLARHPEDFARIRAAVISQFGTTNNPISEPTFESLKACKELTYLMYESLRLYPLVPLNGRTALKDTMLPTGGGKDRKSPIVVKKGEMVGYIAYVLHRRKDLYGEDADEFRPRRWEGRKLGWDFIAFSGGPRVCLGRKFTFLFTLYFNALPQKWWSINSY